MPLLIDDEVNREMLKRYNIDVALIKPLNAAYEWMPRAEALDLESRWHTYWIAKRQLPAAEKLLSSGAYKLEASKHLVPLDYAHNHLTNYIADFKRDINDFEKYARDITKVYA